MGILHFPVCLVLTSILVFSWIPIHIYGYIARPSLSRLDIHTCLFLDTHSHFGVYCTSQSFQSWCPYFAWIPIHIYGYIALPSPFSLGIHTLPGYPFTFWGILHFPVLSVLVSLLCLDTHSHFWVYCTSHCGYTFTPMCMLHFTVHSVSKFVFFWMSVGMYVHVAFPLFVSLPNQGTPKINHCGGGAF